MSCNKCTSVLCFLVWVLHVDGASFLNKPSNLTIKKGGIAVFPCKVENLACRQDVSGDCKESGRKLQWENGKDIVLHAGCAWQRFLPGCDLVVRTGLPRRNERQETSDRVAWFSITSSKLLSLDGHSLSSDNHVIVIIDPIGGFQLHINNVTLHDSGMYKCMVTTDPVMEQTSVLRVIDSKTPGKRRVPTGGRRARRSSRDNRGLPSKNKSTIRRRA